MSRSGYTDDLDYIVLNLYRANVDRSLAGKRGQAFLREMLTAMNAMPEKRLIAHALERTPESVERKKIHNTVQPYEEECGVCATGTVGHARGYDMTEFPAEDNPQGVGKLFGIATCMAAEIEYVNDERGPMNETQEQRFARVHSWIVEKLHGPSQ